jgi:hypothetical protein
MRPKVIFVGIGRSEQRQQALTRKNMATLIGITYDEFCERFAWTNLYGEGAVDAKTVTEADAEHRADLLGPALEAYRRVVLLGDKVARAFGYEQLSKYEWVPLGDSSLVARMPHTSQTNWNVRGPDYWASARAFARSLLEDERSPQPT